MVAFTPTHVMKPYIVNVHGLGTSARETAA